MKEWALIFLSAIAGGVAGILENSTNVYRREKHFTEI